MSKFEITDHRVNQAICYLSETDSPAAFAKAKYNRLFELRKPTKGLIVNELVNGGVKATTANSTAYDDIRYRNHLDSLEQAEIEWFEIRNKRETEATIVDLWRSTNSNRNRGNI